MTPEDRSIVRVWCFAAQASSFTLFEYHFGKNLPIAAFAGLYVSLLSSGLIANAVITVIEEPELILFAVAGVAVYLPLYYVFRYYSG